MNYLISTCGLVCLVLTVNGQLKDEHIEVRQKCYKERGLSNDVIQTTSWRENMESKCYLECYLKGVKSLKEDNVFDAVQSVKLIPEEYQEQSRPLIEACIVKTADIGDACEKSFAGIECLEDGASPGLLLALGMFEPPRAS